MSKDDQGRYEFCQLAETNGGSHAPGLGTNTDTQTDQALKELLKGLQVRVRIETPSPIIETTAPEKTERSATWTFDLDQDPEAFQKIQTMTLRIVFEGQGVNIADFRSVAGSTR